MKKYLSFMAALMMGCMVFTACSSDDDDEQEPQKQAVDVSNGAFIINSGNKRAGIDGSLTYYDFSTKQSQLKAFQAVNGRKLGATANDILVYGNKAYIIVDGENTVEVVDKNTLASVKQISTVELLGEENGSSPRHAAAKDGVVYVSLFGNKEGYVAAIDTATFEMKTSYKVGSKPEELAFVGDSLYVANSDYGYGNASVSVINVATNNVSTITNELIGNPVGVKVVNNELYILDSGSYDYNDNYKQKGAGVRHLAADGTVTKVIDATACATDGKNIYVINAPYGFYNEDGSAMVEYASYNPATKQSTKLQLADLFSPVCIGADPVTGSIFVASASQDPDTGYTSYSLNGYVNKYDAQGNKLDTFECGPGACAIKFNTGVVYE